LQPRPVHRAWPQRGQPEAAALVEAQRADVVVRGGQRDLAAATALGLGANRLNEHRPDPGIQVEGVDRDDLKDARPHVEGDQPGDAARAFGDETGQGGGIEDAIVHDHLGRTPQLGGQPLDRGAVAVLNRPDRHLLLLHRTIIPQRRRLAY
jgi:hypothetical protein